MTSEITPAERQELRRLAPRLERIGSYLAPIKGDKIGVFVKRNKYARPVLTTTNAFLQSAIRHALIAPSPDKDQAFALTEIGRAFLRRAESPHDPYRSQHQKIAASRHHDAPNALENKSQTGLDWLRHRQKSNGKGSIIISQVEFDAGDRLRADFDAGRMTPHMCVDWSRPIVGGSRARTSADHMPANALDARRKFQDALNYVGAGLADILVQTCCTETGLEQCEKEFGWPRRSAKLVLKMALNRLSVYYGLQSPRAASASLRIR